MGSNRAIRSLDDLPHKIAVFPLAGSLLLPRSDVTLNIFEPRYIKMIDDCLGKQRIIGMIQPSHEQSDAARPTLASIGCLGKISQFSETDDGRYLINLTGVIRFRVASEALTTKPYRICNVDYSAFAHDLSADPSEAAVDRAALFNTLRGYAEKNQLAVDWDSVEKAPSEALVNALSIMSPFGLREKQALLEAPNIGARANVLIAIAELSLVRCDNLHSPLH